MASPKNKEPHKGQKRRKKMAEKITRKDLFARIAETMNDDAEVVAMCEKYIAQLSKPRVHKTKPEVVEFREAVAEYLAGAEGPLTNKELSGALGVSHQKMAAALRWLVGEGRVIRTEGEGKSDPATFVIA
jgi:hypothetical protein